MSVYDPAPRWKKVLDATSQLLNVLAAPDHTLTTSNESLSGRSYRAGWRIARIIDWFFRKVTGEEDHCRNSYLNDVKRARNMIEWHQDRWTE